VSDDFNNAELYDCDDGEEHLRWECPSTAIERWLNGFMSPGCDAEAIIREHTPLTVYAFARDGYDPNWHERRALYLAEYIEESWQDDFGGEDNPFSDEHRETLVRALMPAIEAFAKSVNVWRCSQCAKREYSTEEVLAMMRSDTCWFDDEGKAP